MPAFLFVLFVWLCLLVFCLLLVGSSFTQCNSCLPTARGSLPLTRAGIFTEQSTFSDRRSFVRVAAVAQKKKPHLRNSSELAALSLFDLLGIVFAKEDDKCVEFHRIFKSLGLVLDLSQGLCGAHEKSQRRTATGVV